MQHVSRLDYGRMLESFVGAMAPGGRKQYHDEISATQNYIIGSRQVVGMTVYHYAKMAAAAAVDGTNQFKGVGNSLGLDEQNTSATPTTVAVGSLTLPILDAASAAHVYQNAKVFVWPDGGAQFQAFDILDNEASDGTNVVLHLARPVRVAIAAGTFTSIYRNPYSAVASLATIGTGLAPVVGVPQTFVTAGYYFWVATWGIAGIVQGEDLDGDDGPDVVFSRVDGSVWKKSTSIAVPDSWQHAGHMVPEQTGGKDAGIFLQLDP
jgi:rhodanese-related sulfurtransferase